VPMCHPSVVRFRQLMGYDEGNTLKSQDHREGLRALPLKAMECDNNYSKQAKQASGTLTLRN
jgi:hypothetical protein